MLRLRNSGIQTVRTKALRRTRRTMHIQHLPMRWGRGDNYAYLLTDCTTKESWLIDPANPEDIDESLVRASNVKAVVNSHHHYDHSSGNEHYKKLLGVKVIGGSDCNNVGYTPRDGEKLTLGRDLQITAIYTPCHTQDSICYFAEDTTTGEKALFTGDTLFTAGCGRFFEGEPDEMLSSLAKLKALPGDTKVYPGHEYTKSNAAFAQTVMDNQVLQSLIKFCEHNEVTTGKFTIADELAFNPFMNCESDDLKAKFHADTSADLMRLFRRMKNSF